MLSFGPIVSSKESSFMGIQNNQVVSFHYALSELTDDGVEVALESTRNGMPVSILMGHQNMLPKVEAAMLDREVGDKFDIELQPEQAYGRRYEEAVQRVPIKHLLTKGKLRVGQLVRINSKPQPQDARVVKVGKFNVDVDANHPLAGKTIKFDIEIISVRDASEEEIDHGHAHTDGNH